MTQAARLPALLFAVILGAAVSGRAQAAACTTVASGNWNATATWNAACTVVGGNGADGPDADDTVTIGATHTVSLTAPAAATSISITAATAANGIVLNGNTLTVSGAVTMNAPSTNNITSTFNVGSGTLNAASISIDGNSNGRVALMTVSSGTITTTGSISFSGTTANTRLTSTGASMINVGGSFGSGGTLTTSGTGTINLNGAGAQSLGAYTTYNNVTINKSAGTVTLAGTVTVGGTLNVTRGAFRVGASNFQVSGPTNIGDGTLVGTIDQTSASGSAVFVGLVTVYPGSTWSNSTNEAVTFRGGITNNGSFNAGTATQSFNTNSQALGGANPITFGGGVLISGAITLTNNNTNTVTISGALNGDAGGSTWVNAAGSTLSYTSNTSNTAPMATGVFTASASPNTVNYSRAGTQSIRTPTGSTYHHLSLSGTSAKTALAGLTVNGDLTLSGSATFTTSNFTHNFLGNWVVNTTAGTPIIATGSTINFNTPTVPAATSISGTTTATLALATVNVNNTSGLTVGNNLSASGNLTVASGATLTPGAAVIVSGTGTLTGTGTVKVTRTLTTADFSAQYAISNTTLTNLTVEYAGAGAQNVTALTYGGLKINNASGATLAAGTSTVNGTLTLTTGALTLGANTLVLNGPAIPAGSGTLTTSASSNLSFGGSSTGVYVPGSVLNLNNLTLNNTNGLTLNSSPTIAGVLTLTSGAVSTGANILKTSTNCTSGSVTRGTGFVNGYLQLTFPTAASPGVTCTYYVGSGTNYAPIGLTVITTATTTLTGSTAGNEHPQISSSSIDPTKDVNRYWSLWKSGDSASNLTGYGATFNFVSGDLDITATPTNFVIGKYAASAWTLPTPLFPAPTATSTSVSNVAGPITATIDFAAGEIPAACNVPSDLATWAGNQSPAVTLSCVCDNFGRASLNPSTIYGQNWVVSNSDATGIVPSIVNTGYLRLTNNTTLNAKAATVPSSFPAAGNVIFVEFKHFAYNGTTGADGIALTLSDASQTPTPGAFGGSLGYAQKCQNGVSGCFSDCTTAGGCPGFNGGWVGIAIDEYGNFSNNIEGRSGGTAPGLIIDSVSARGSGSGQTGYPYLSGTGTLSPEIDNAASTTAARGHAYRLMVDARSYAANHAYIAVDRDTTGTGNSYASVLPSFDIFVANPTQSTVPQNWKLSFTGSTGASTNIHEISGLKICAQTITPPAGFLIQVDNLSPSTCSVAGGSPAAPIITVKAVDSNGVTVTSYTQTVTLAAKQFGGAASAAVWSKVSGNANGSLSASTGNGSQTYQFAAADLGVAKFYLIDASSQDIYLTVTESGGSPSTSLATPILYRGGSFTVAVNDPIGSTLVAGRPHQMQVTRTNCGSGTDTAYTGTKSLDAWYDPVLADHPAGALAPQICPLNGSSTCLPAAGSPCITLSINSPSLSATSNNLSIGFSSGVANYCLVTSDVGKYSVGMRDDSNIATPISGATPTLTARPFAVVVSGVTGNPGGSGSGSTVFTSAGTSFPATVGAYLWNTAADTGANGLPGSVSLDTLTSAGLAPHYSDTVTLSATTPYTPASTTGPPPFVAGTLGNGTVSVTAGGVATVSTLNYNEIGSFTLAATPASTYLNTVGLNLSNRVAIYAMPADTSVQNAWVGRFIPHHFSLSAASLAAACSTATAFTYFDQDGFTTSFTVTAETAGSLPTTNYAGAWAKLPLTVWSTAPASAASPGFGFAAATLPTGSALVASTTDPTGTWSSGTANVVAKHRITRPTNPAIPTILTMSALPVDSDGVTMTAAVDLGTTQQRFGVLKVDSSYGSELLPIRVPVRTMYCAAASGANCTQWRTNTDDGCTALSAVMGSLAYGASGTPLANSNFRISGTDPNTNTGTTGNWMSASSLIVASGMGTIVLNKPCVGGPGAACTRATGSVDLTLDLTSLPWLKGTWTSTGNWNENPIARIKFGSPKAPYIYLRERY